MIYCAETSISGYRRVLETLIKKCLVNPRYAITCLKDKCLIPLKNTNIDVLDSLEINIRIVECAPPINNKRGKNLKKLMREYLGEKILDLIPRSYDIIGDVIVIQLPEELKDYYCFIADLLLYLHPNVKAVYRRSSETKGEYRVREVEHIGGAKVKETIYREHGISFYVLLGLVYINPSFSYEHKVISELVDENEKILDMFAGIGGFTLNIAVARKTRIVAVDINPWAVYCGVYSINLNKKKIKGNITYFNSDIRVVTQYIRSNYFDRIIMNLPLYSIEFLPIAIKHSKNRGIIHLYSVERNYSTLEEKILKIAYKYSKNVIIDIIDYRKVLDYAPYKYIYRVDLAIRKTMNIV